MLHFRGIDQFLRFKTMYLKNSTVSKHRLCRHDYWNKTPGVSGFSIKNSRRPHKGRFTTKQGWENREQKSFFDREKEIKFGEIPTVKDQICAHEKDQATQTKKSKTSTENEADLVFS